MTQPSHKGSRRVLRSFAGSALALLLGCLPGCVNRGPPISPPAPLTEPELPAAQASALPPGDPAAKAPDAPTSPPTPPPTPPVEAPPAAPPAIFNAADGDWPMWGGSPSRNPVNTREKGLPATWDPKSKQNIKWVAALGSQSYGNVVVAGGKVLAGTNNNVPRNPKVQGDRGVLMCFSAADGSLYWQAIHEKLASGRANDWPEQGIASSPCVENGKVYYVSNRAELVCADLEGFHDAENNGPFKSEKLTDEQDADFIWILDMIGELNVFPKNLATCSPLVIHDLVYVVTSNGPGEDNITIPSPKAPSFIAVDKSTGKVVWQSNAPGDAIFEGQWSAPGYVVAGGKPQIVFPGGDGWIRGFDPVTGSQIWQFDVNPRGSVHEVGGRGTKNVPLATPVCVNGKVYIGVGLDPEYGEGGVGHFYAIDASKEGDITETGRLWLLGDKDFHRTISTASVQDGFVYAVELSGYLRCLDAETGKVQWTHDMLAAVWGSPTWIDGKVYLGDEDGDVVVLAAGPKLEVLAEVQMGNAIYGTPVASGGVLYIMTRTQLFAIAGEAK